MAAHLAFMNAQIGGTAHALMKNMRAAQRTLGGTMEPHVYAIQTEDILQSGAKKEVRRVFVKASDSGDYAHVGYIMSMDVDNCMVCNQPFGLFTGKSHCAGCGILVCSSCSPEKAIVLEIESQGEQVVCVQCNFGQGIVEGVRTLRLDEVDGNGVARNTAKVTMGSKPQKMKTKKEEEEEARKKQEEEDEKARMEAEEYEKQLLARIQMPRTPSMSTGAASAGGGSPGVDNSDRSHRSAGGSPLPGAVVTEVVCKTVLPVPGYVMKTRKAGEEKVFINVLSTDTITKDSDVTISEKKFTTDKKGGRFEVYDAVIGTALMNAVLNDASNERQKELGVRIIGKLNELHDLGLDSNFSTPLINNNYKGDGAVEMTVQVTEETRGASSSSSSSEYSPVDADGKIVPSPGVVIRTRDLREKLTVYINLCTHDRVPKPAKPVLFTGAARMAQARAGEPIFRVFDAVVHPSTLEAVLPAGSREEDLSGNANLMELAAKVIKVIKAKGEEVDATFTLPNVPGHYKSDASSGSIASFSLPEMSHPANAAVGDNAGSQKANLNITPYPGLVIACSKVRRNGDSEEVFVNLTHHPALVRAENSKYYMLSANAEYAPHPDNPQVVCKVYMAVVHSELLEFMMKDKTGEARDQLFGEVIALLNANYAAALSFDVDVPFNKDGFIAQAGGGLPSILNFPPSDKEVQTDHVGYLFKQGHGYKSWKRRKFLLQGRSLKYFDETVLKGTMDVKDAYCEDCPASECNAPADAFCFKLVMPRQATYMYAISAEDRDVWKTAIEAKANQIRNATTDVHGNRILLRRGYLKKEGHIVRNWKKRFVVVDMGVLTYYEKASAGNALVPPVPPYGEGEKGRIVLCGATVSKENVDGRLGVNMNRIYISGKNVEDLLLEADTEVAADAWHKDIVAHIEFANANPHLVDNDEDDATLLRADSVGVGRERNSSSAYTMDDNSRGSGTFSFLSRLSMKK